MKKFQRGDTIIEVIVAFTVFALLAVSTMYLMNRSLSAGQRSLEITLVRQQVDTQAELLRYVRDNQTPAWAQVKSASLASGSIGITNFSTCPQTAPASSFIMRINNATNNIDLVNLNPANYQAAPYYSRSNATGSTVAEGLWVTPVQVNNSNGNVYDMYIRGCWDSVGSNQPQVVSTIVRLYDT